MPFVQRFCQFIILPFDMALNLRGNIQAPKLLCGELVEKIVDILFVICKVPRNLRLQEVGIILNLWY